MENNIKEGNKYNYNSILQKINHKPILVEYIFPYIKDEPYKFLRVIENDQTLKESINSQFYNVTKKNAFSKEINDNIQLVIYYKKFIEIFRQYKNKDNLYFQKYAYEKYIIKNNSDPSFILYKTRTILNKIKEDKSLLEPSLDGLFDIALNEQEKYEHIQLAFLPVDKNNKYKDSLYIQQNLNNDNDLDKNNNCMNKEIDTLYCIIDDNEYYLDRDKKFNLNKNIVINEIYFIYIKGIKDININDAIRKYLNSLNKKNIKQIIYGNSFYKLEIKNRGENEILENEAKIPIIQMINDALINNKKYTFPMPIIINIKLLMERYSEYFSSKLINYFGIYHLFPGNNIDDIMEINSKFYHSNMLEKIENFAKKIFIIKYNGLSSLDDSHFNKFVKKCLIMNIPNIIFYIAKDSNDNKKNNDKTINLELDKNTNYLLYSEIPTKKLNLGAYKCLQVIDFNNNIILQGRDNYNYFYNYFKRYFFLLKIYNYLCFKWNFDKDIYFKMFFIKKKIDYDIYIYINNKPDEYCMKYYTTQEKIKTYIDLLIKVNFENVINYCKNILNLKINNIHYQNIPFDWSDIFKKETKNKNKNKKGGSSAKLFSNKMNKNQILEYELEDDDYYEEEEENDEFQDDNN